MLVFVWGFCCCCCLSHCVAYGILVPQSGNGSPVPYSGSAGKCSGVLTIGPSGKSRDFCCLVSFLEIMLGKPALRNVIFKQIYRRVLILEHLRLKSLLLPTQSRLHPERGPAHQHVLCDARKALSGDASRFVPERSRMGGKEKSKNKHC